MVKLSETIEEFATRLELYWQQGKTSEASKHVHAGCQLPWHLRFEADKVASLLPQYRVKVRVSELETYVEISR